MLLYYILDAVFIVIVLMMVGGMTWALASRIKLTGSRRVNAVIIALVILAVTGLTAFFLARRLF